MSETQTKQRLAAILAADAVGYSRLMTSDDRGTLAALDAARAVFRKHIVASQGRVVDMAGDSVLAVFETATGAVAAALAVQHDLDASMSEIPSDQRLFFRIGIHLGDVIEKGDGTIYGDGVNIAARLQALAPSGGVVISEAVRGSVKNRVAARFVDLGKQTVKNIAEPVRAFQVQATDGKALSRAAPRRVSWVAGALAVVAALIVGAGWYALHGGLSMPSSERTDTKSIAVLPFANISDDKDTAYFADGVHEDLLTQLALLGDLKVISRVSVMDYRNTKKNVRQIGSELGVASVVEGSVRRAGNQVRVTAQLIDAKSDKHLWAKSYDRELKDIFAIQSELATEIARQLKVSLDPQDQKRLAKRPTDNLEAYDLFLRAQEIRNQTVGKAVALDPNFALAWAKLAAEHGRAYLFGVDRTPANLQQADIAFQKAQALAPADPLVKIEAGNYHMYAHRDMKQAEKAYTDVLAVAPYSTDALQGLADVRGRQLQWAEHAALLERALGTDPRNPRTLNALSIQYRDFRQYDRALALLRQFNDLRPGNHDAQVKLYLTGYWRSGSWEAYDKWRQTLPKGEEAITSRVKFVDIDRALGRRDFDEALRLLDVQPTDLKELADNVDRLSDQVARAVILHAKGDRGAALKLARATLPQIAVELQKLPEDAGLLDAKGVLHALLGDRDEAFSALAKRVALAQDKGDLLYAEMQRRDRLRLHALLGDRDQAIAELERQVRLPAVFPHALRVDPWIASLWDDAKFQALINDPANNAPLSFDTKYGLLPEK